MTITINNEARELVYRSRAMRKLGILGFGDAENIGRVLREALMDFDAFARLISVGLGEQADPSSVDDYLDTLTAKSCVPVIKLIAQDLGVEIELPGMEGEQGGPPESLPNGKNAEPLPDTTSA